MTRDPLDLAILSLEPKRWPRRWRRALIVTAPVSFPLYAGYFVVALVGLHLVATLDLLRESLVELWNDDDPVTK